MRNIMGNFFLALMICTVSAQQTPQSTKQPQNVGTAVTQPVQTPQKSALNATGIHATRVKICLNVDNHEPEGEGETFPQQVKRLYCFTQISSSGETDEIQHRWYWKDELMNSIPLKIKSGNFRTYSAKSIPENALGDWRVAIVNSRNEEVIGIVKFFIK